MGSVPAIDVLVLTAADGEDVALCAVDEGAVGGWEEFSLDGLPGRYGVRAFEVAGGRQLRVAHAHAQRMGETNAAAVAVAVVRALQPEILAMCGVCAGRPKWTNLGDVVIADVLYEYDAGEVVAGQGGMPAHFKADGAHRDLPASWRAHAQAFGQEFAASAAGQRLLAQRPWPLEVAELWLLAQLDCGGDPSFGVPIHLEKDAWRALVEQLRNAPQTEHLLRWLANAYAARPRAGIAPVEPDLLGEQLVIEALQHPDTPPTFFAAVFQDADRAAYTAAFLVLGRLGARADGPAVDQWIERLIGDCDEDRVSAALAAIVTLCTDVPIGPLLAERLKAGQGTLDVARAVEAALDIDEPTATTGELLLRATRRQLAELGDVMDEERSRLLSNLGGLLRDLGQQEAGLQATREAVTIDRRLADASPQDFLPNLASSLSDLAVQLRRQHQRDEAMQVAQEATAIYRELARLRPDEFLRELAIHLSSSGTKASTQRDALAAAQEGLTIFRKLAEVRTETSLADLAMSLNNIGCRWFGLNEVPEARQAVQQAVAIYRALVQAEPATFLPRLAMALSNLGCFAGQLEAAQEAVQLYRELAAARPDVYRHGLMGALMTLKHLRHGTE